MSEPQSAGTRVVLLGASNLSAGLRQIAALARAGIDGPLELHAAAGNGRSYGQLSHFLGRVLPGIDACGLWGALEATRSQRTLALVTDIGNDLAFGASAGQVHGWLELALERLARHGASVVITGLPLASVERMPAWEFRLWSKLLFPWHAIERSHLLGQARELDARLDELARARGLVKVDPLLEWYGHDPIHVRRGARGQAWASYLAPLGLRASRPAALEWSGRLWYERVRVLGRECGVPQPCARFAPDGSLRLY